MATELKLKALCDSKPISKYQERKNSQQVLNCHAQNFLVGSFHVLKDFFQPFRCLFAAFRKIRRTMASSTLKITKTDIFTFL